jgi:D-sorbitol dehydrogenase (acceptor)
VNVEGLLFTLQTVAKQMIKQGRGGKIINFAATWLALGFDR